MQAEVGDRLVARGRHVGERDRHGEVLEVHGENGAPPYLVRWEDGRTDLFFPAADTVVEHAG